MIKSIREAEEGWKADLLRVFATCAPFMLYFLYLDMEYSSHIEDLTLMTLLSYVDHLLSHTHDFIIIAFTVFIGSAGVLFGPIFARMRVSFRFGEQINKLTGKLNRTETDAALYLDFIQHVKQISHVIALTMEKLEYSLNSIPLDLQQKIIRAVGELSEDLAKGLCGNLQRETLNVRKALDQTQNHFADYIQNHNITVRITCPEDLTVATDPLFARLILLNVLGIPICSTQSNGEIFISVSQSNGYAHVEIEDRRNILTDKGRKYLKFPKAFLAGDDELRKLCFQSGWGYEFKDLEQGKFYTKVAIPIEDYQDFENNGVGFGFRH